MGPTNSPPAPGPSQPLDPGAYRPPVESEDLYGDGDSEYKFSFNGMAVLRGLIIIFTCTSLPLQLESRWQSGIKVMCIMFTVFIMTWNVFLIFSEMMKWCLGIGKGKDLELSCIVHPFHLPLCDGGDDDENEFVEPRKTFKRVKTWAGDLILAAFLLLFTCISISNRDDHGGPRGSRDGGFGLNFTIVILEVLAAACLFFGMLGPVTIVLRPKSGDNHHQYRIRLPADDPQLANSKDPISIAA